MHDSHDDDGGVEGQNDNTQLASALRWQAISRLYFGDPRMEYFMGFEDGSTLSHSGIWRGAQVLRCSGNSE